MWQYRAYIMDSVSSDQAIVTYYHHSLQFDYLVMVTTDAL